MNISGIRPTEGFYLYNSIRTNMARVQAVQATQQEEDTKAEVEVDAGGVDYRQNQKYNAYDYAQSYRPGESYDLKGVDSDIKSLDVRKVRADLSKDSILQQYQYFVGAKDKQNPSGEGIRVGENFVL